MVLDTDKMITTFSAIFTIVIISATGVQNVINEKLRKQLINNLFLKHSILIASIYTTDTHEILQFSDDDGQSLSMKFLKSILIWVFLILLFKIDFNLIIIIIALVIGSKAVKELDVDNKYKQKLLKGATYSIVIVYIYGVYGYFSKNKTRGNRSIIDSILKTL